MNNFGFYTSDVIVSIVAFFGTGLLFGCILGLVKYLLFAFLVRRIPKGLAREGGEYNV